MNIYLRNNACNVADIYSGGRSSLPSRGLLFFRGSAKLGGRCGPEKKYLAPPPPPKIPQFAADTLPAPRPLLFPPPPGILNKNDPPPSWRLGLPQFPLPEQEKKKSETSTKKRVVLKVRETLYESGRWIDALKKRGRVLKKRGRVLRSGGGS